MTQLYAGARLDGESGDLCGFHLGDELADAPGDGDAVFVELALPEHAGEDGAPEACSGVRMAAGAPSWVRGRACARNGRWLSLRMFSFMVWPPS